MTNPLVLTTDIPGLVRQATGKVRDVYRVGDDAVLLVATDRISAFDVVLSQGIPDKGRVLTQLSVYWFHRLSGIIPNHLITTDDDTIARRVAGDGVVVTDELRAMLRGRAMLCRRSNPLPIEAVVRGYLSGSAWKAYRDASAAVEGDSVDLWGVALPRGLQESDRLPQPIFTPSTKSAEGHDLPMRQTEIESYIGSFAEPVRQAALSLYGAADDEVRARGIIIADTKFEFGTVPGPGDDSANFELLLIDEALTPDSSRFWDAETYAPGGAQPSFDKQFLRDYLETVPGWDKQPPAPELPAEIIEKTAAKYRDAYHRITGTELV